MSTKKKKKKSGFNHYYPWELLLSCSTFCKDQAQSQPCWSFETSCIWLGEDLLKHRHLSIPKIQEEGKQDDDPKKESSSWSNRVWRPSLL